MFIQEVTPIEMGGRTRRTGREASIESVSFGFTISVRTTDFVTCIEICTQKEMNFQTD